MVKQKPLLQPLVQGGQGIASPVKIFISVTTHSCWGAEIWSFNGTRLFRQECLINSVCRTGLTSSWGWSWGCRQSRRTNTSGDKGKGKPNTPPSWGGRHQKMSHGGNRGTLGEAQRGEWEGKWDLLSCVGSGQGYSMRKHKPIPWHFLVHRGTWMQTSTFWRHRNWSFLSHFLAYSLAEEDPWKHSAAFQRGILHRVYNGGCFYFKLWFLRYDSVISKSNREKKYFQRQAAFLECFGAILRV